MSIFGNIMSKIFNAGSEAIQASTTPAAAGTETASVPATAPAAAAAPVDVEAVLTGMAAQKGGGGNWQSSIVDLLKLLDFNSSLDARKELANELDTHAGADGSAEENTALHKAVMQKLAENGGKVPASLKG